MAPVQVNRPHRMVVISAAPAHLHELMVGERTVTRTRRLIRSCPLVEAPASG